MGLYIIGNVPQKICKIGVSDTPDRRVRQIQTGCPYKVHLLAFFPDLGFESEKEYHKRYKSEKMHGEWFKMVPEIMSIVDQYQGRDKPAPVSGNVREIPPISYEDYQKQTRPRGRRKNQSRYVKAVFNHK